MTTLTVLTAAVRNRCNLPSSDARVSDADIMDFINQSYQDFEAEYDWPWRQEIDDFNITAGVSEYFPPTALRKTLTITLNDPYIPLIRKTWKWTRRLANPEITGTPNYYTEFNEKIFIYPAPDIDYTAKYLFMVLHSDLTTGTDQVNSPQWADRIVVTRASSYVAQKLRDSEQYQMFESEYKRQLKTATDEVSRTYEPIQVDVRGDW